MVLLIQMRTKKYCADSDVLVKEEWFHSADKNDFGNRPPFRFIDEMIKNTPEFNQDSHWFDWLWLDDDEIASFTTLS